MNRNRRKFLRAAAAGGVAYAFGRTPGTVFAQAAGVGGFTDYKALVCVFLAGGNDSWNMVVPRTTAEYSAYAASRGGQAPTGLAVPLGTEVPINPIGTTGAPFGLHPNLTELATLFQQQRCAIVANVGPLVAPTTKAQYTAGSVPLPPQLFSHNDQQDQWHTLRGRNSSKTGWAGRVADVLASQLGNQQLSTNISLAGNTLFQASDTVSPYVMGSAGPTAFSGFGATGTSLARKQAIDAINAINYGTVYERRQAAVTRRALQAADNINAAIAAAPALTTVFPTNNTLATQLQTVAKMIAVRDRLGMSRQVFFVSIGGFDTHDDLLADQPTLYRNVSTAMAAFYSATVELGVANNVTAFTQSDFGRTLTSNGDGSDHAWGGVQIAVGGAVQGQKIYGTMPVLRVGATLAADGADDVSGGRFIPTTSADQYAATLAKWFGVNDTNLALVAPSLGNFALKNLGMLG